MLATQRVQLSFEYFLITFVEIPKKICSYLLNLLFQKKFIIFKKSVTDLITILENLGKKVF